MQQQLSMSVARAEATILLLTSLATILLPRVAAVAGGKLSLKTCFIKGDNLYCGAADGDRGARCSIMPWRGPSLNGVTGYTSRNWYILFISKFPDSQTLLRGGKMKCACVLHGRPQVEMTGHGMTGGGRQDSGTGGAASHAEIVLTFIILSQFLKTEHFQENSFLISTRLGPELCNFNFIDFWKQTVCKCLTSFEIKGQIRGFKYFILFFFFETQKA